MRDLKSMDLNEMTAFMREVGEPAFRGKQVYQWLHRGAASFQEMSNLSKSLREKLSESCFITVPQVERKLVSRQDGTIKYLWRLRLVAVHARAQGKGPGMPVMAQRQSAFRRFPVMGRAGPGQIHQKLFRARLSALFQMQTAHALHVQRRQPGRAEAQAGQAHASAEFVQFLFQH